MTAIVVCRTQHVECVFHDRGGDVLLITFNEMGMRANGHAVWGQEPARKLGLSIVGFVTTKPNWFPADDMNTCLAALDAILDGRNFHKITFGLSQGGYASLKYSGRLKADTNIAFSPQISISPDDVKDRRFIKFYDETIHCGMIVTERDVAGHSFVLYDPYDAGDAEHCELIGKATTACLVRLPFVGHSSIRPFAGTRYLDAILRACMARDKPELHRIYKAVKSRNPHRAYLMALELASKKPNVALRIFEKYHSLVHSSPWHTACYQLAISGKGDAVIEWVSRKAKDTPTNHSVQACAALVSLQIKDPSSAVYFIERALRLVPDQPAYSHVHKRAMAMLRAAAASGAP
jgi:hypothetical protein